MKKKGPSKKINLDDLFYGIFRKFEGEMDIRIMDLHSIQLALRNLPRMKEVAMPNIYISYLMKRTAYRPQDLLASYTQKNVLEMLARTNNHFAQNIFYLAEDCLIEGLIMLKTIQSQKSSTINSKLFKEQLDTEQRKKRTFGSLGNEIKRLVKKSGPDIIPEDCPYYTFLENYVLLRNCLTHRGGKITEKEKTLAIRLPYISKEQLETAARDKTKKTINPQTMIRKWNPNDHVQLTLEEVEGISWGLLKTLFKIFTHLYRAADKHIEGIQPKNP